MKLNLESESMKNKLPWMQTSLARAAMAVTLLVAAFAVQAQNVTQTANFTPVAAFYPQYMGSGGTTRLPTMFQATISGLTASTTYRYYTQAGISTDVGLANSGAGNPMLVNSAGTTFTYTTNPSLTGAGGYESFTTDASGSYTGWFGFVYTANARFTAGNAIFPILTIGNNSGTVLNRWAPLSGSGTILCLAFSTSAGANNGTGIRGTSSATAKNFVTLQDNIAGTGRPLAVTYAESESISVASAVGYYGSTGSGPVDGITGAWGTIIPNTLPNGVRRIAQYNNSGSLIAAYTDTDGVWPSGANTVSPAGGSSTPIVISSTDAPLTCTTPNAYAVTGGGSYCSGGSGVAVGLANSETGVTYQLKKDGVNSGSPVSGTTGNAITFGPQTAAGTYTVVATRTTGGCTADMTGSATVATTTGTTTWASGGSHTVTVIAANGDPGWNQIRPCQLDVTATPSSTFTIHVSGSPADFNSSSSYQWAIAVADAEVSGFNYNKFILDTAGFVPSFTGSFSIALVNKSVVLVYTPAPAPCANTTTATSQVVGVDPNFQMEMTFINASGLSSVQSLVMINCSVNGEAFDGGNNSLGAVGLLSLTSRTLLPPNTQKVVLLATKADTALSATVNVIAIDTCGRGVSFDPIITTLEVLAGNKVEQRFDGLMSAERYLHVLNGTPGLRRVEVSINGRGFRADLSDGQSFSSELGRAMREGTDNVVVLTGYGEVGSSAFVTLTDTPTGTLEEMEEVVLLTLGYSANGLRLSWPETLEGWQLQSSATAEGGWADVTGTPVAVEGQWTVSVPTTGSAQFYRLLGPTAARAAASGSPSEARLSVRGATQPQSLQHSYDALLW